MLKKTRGKQSLYANYIEKYYISNIIHENWSN